MQTMLMHRSANCESSNINMSRPIAKTTKGYIQTLYHSLQKYHVMNNVVVGPKFDLKNT